MQSAVPMSPVRSAAKSKYIHLAFIRCTALPRVEGTPTLRVEKKLWQLVASLFTARSSNTCRCIKPACPQGVRTQTPTLESTHQVHREKVDLKSSAIVVIISQCIAVGKVGSKRTIARRHSTSTLLGLRLGRGKTFLNVLYSAIC